MKGYTTREFKDRGPSLAVHVQEGGAPYVVFQHGLCGDAKQPAEVFPSDAPARHVVMECRGHGESEAGSPEALSIATFADDLATVIETKAIAPCVVGGISMGAAIALRLACKRPDLVSGLVLARPAWIFDDAPANMLPNLEVGERLVHSPQPGELDDFLGSDTGRMLARQAPDNLSSLSGFFTREPREVTAALLSRISRDGPGVTATQVTALNVPTLVLGTADDVIHPLSHARELALLIPGARLAEIPPKASDKNGYLSAFRAELGRFLLERHDARRR